MFNKWTYMISPASYYVSFQTFIYYLYSVVSAYMSARQKTASELFIDSYEPPCGCWELNSGPPEEQSVLLTAEPSLQPSSGLWTNSLKGICELDRVLVSGINPRSDGSHICWQPAFVLVDV